MKVEIAEYPAGKARRKVNVKLDHFDLWSLDHTLALVVLPALKKFRKHSLRGIPGSLYDQASVDKHKPLTKRWKAAERQASERGARDWDRILDQMIWSFDQIARDVPDEPKVGKDKRKFRREWRAYNKRLDAGLSLFARYYRSLWT